MWWYDCLVCVIQTSKDSNNVMFVSHVALPETSSNGVKRKRRKLQPHYEPMCNAAAVHYSIIFSYYTYLPS